jgi:hypothetical protein
MPWSKVKSRKQQKYIFAQAAKGKPWAKKFVADSHGSKLGSDSEKEAIKAHAKRRKLKRKPKRR